MVRGTFFCLNYDKSTIHIGHRLSKIILISEQHVYRNKKHRRIKWLKEIQKIIDEYEDRMMKAVQYGAGNIGRGFIGQLFSQSGYEVVFIDVNQEMVIKLNEDHSYPIKVVSEKGHKEIIISNVRAVDGKNIKIVSDEIADADIMATAVGVNVLPRIAKPIAMGLKKKWAQKNMKPLNIIICENLLDANRYLEGLIKKELSKNEISLFDKTVGLVEASIGRMVPVMTPEMQKGNILRVCVEEYCELPVEKDAFKGEIPNILNMVPFSPFEFFIQRKLFIHNMGHALTAYLGHLNQYKYIWEANKNQNIKLIAERAMTESAVALSQEHDIPLNQILEHVDDLLYRFGNRYLGDTIERVGRDPIRKLGYNDRLVGAANLAIKHNTKPIYICLGIATALCFDEESDQFATRIQQMILKNGPESVLKNICAITEDAYLWEIVMKFYQLLKDGVSLENCIVLAEASK